MCSLNVFHEALLEFMYEKELIDSKCEVCGKEIGLLKPNEKGYCYKHNPKVIEEAQFLDIDIEASNWVLDTF
jgi:hypothetical protein